MFFISYILDADGILFLFSSLETAMFYYSAEKRLAYFWCYFIFWPKIGVFGRKWHRK